MSDLNSAAPLDPKWYDAISTRISRRRYTGEPTPAEAVAQLQHFCSEYRPFDRVRVVFVEHAPSELFTGIVGSYGRVDGAPSAALLVGPKGRKIEIGYAGEAFVLEASRLGVDTCWIAGGYSRKRAISLTPLEADEHVPAIIAVGVAEAKQGLAEQAVRSYVRASSRLPVDDLVEGVGAKAWPGWAVSAVESTRLAPSGGNSQPWRFRLEGGALVLARKKIAYPTVELDLGIAMLHVELGAQHEGVTGRWERLAANGVARFVPDLG